MSLIEIRKRSLTIETIHHEGGPAPAEPLKLAASCAVIRNPYAGRYEPDLMPFMAELRSLGTLLAQELVDTLGKDKVEVYSKAAIVGVNGELEHAAVWHEAGGWAMRAVLGEPKAIVPASKAVAPACPAKDPARVPSIRSMRSAKGRAASAAVCARRSFEAATIFMAEVICMVD